MTEDELLTAVRERIADPRSRIDMTTLGTPQVYAGATRGALDAAESELGFPLPALLRRLYLEVENGGFGPGAGLVGVDGGYPDPDGRTLSASYAVLRLQDWPEGLVPLCDLGDGAWSCFDGRAADGRIVTMVDSGATRTRFTLFSWLEAWVSGVDLLAETFEVEDGVIVNPFTKNNVAVKRRGRAKGE